MPPYRLKNILVKVNEEKEKTKKKETESDTKKSLPYKETFYLSKIPKA